MKKVLLLSLALFFINWFGYSQCTTGPSSGTPGITPPSDSLDCVQRSLQFDEFIRVDLPGVTSVATLNSLTINSITGYPTGISHTCNPSGCVLPGNMISCINITGTTSDPAGSYPLTITASASTSLGSFGPLPLSSLLQLAGLPNVTYALEVIELGTPCRGTVGISVKAAPSTEASMTLFPNPNTGTFSIAINGFSSEKNYDLKIFDMQGKQVYNEAIVLNSDRIIKSLQLNQLNKGVYSVNLSSSTSQHVQKLVIH